jgi:metallo-beta-lactamase family protein
MQIKFIGATKNVTGSKTLVKGSQSNLLIDCGLYQGAQATKLNNDIARLLKDEKIDALILTHAHLDHCGYLPKLYKDGFRGPIFCTEATRDIAQIILSDNAKIQSSDAKKANRKITKKKLKVVPLYTQTEVDQVLKLFRIQETNVKFRWQEYEIEFYKAGHILGAVSPLLSCNNKHILFSGDYGRQDDLVIYPPDKAPQADYLVIESTYGNRLHLNQNIDQLLKKLISQALHHNAAILIPAFSLGRSQTIMKLLYDFFEENPELKLPVFVDSPMTHAITKLYFKFKSQHKIPSHVLKQIEQNFQFIKFKNQKDNLDQLTSAHIILTAGGMLTGGNILRHLQVKGTKPHNMIWIVGYQSEETIGRALLDGLRTHTIEEKKITIEAQVIDIQGLSSHADHDELIQYAKESQAKKVFITHGEQSAKEQLKRDLENQLQVHVVIPHTLELFDLP